jgi:hypothetical protein
VSERILSRIRSFGYLLVVRREGIFGAYAKLSWYIENHCFKHLRDPVLTLYVKMLNFVGGENIAKTSQRHNI